MLIRTALCFLLISIVSLNFSGSLSKAAELSVAQITPSGEEIPAVQQILLSFNQDVVPLGRMERESSDIPIKIKPELSCQWRWLTPNSLACQLDQGKALRLATTYTLTIGTAALNEQGDALAAPYRHTFSTARPKITHANFHSITERGKPLTQLHFNQAVTKSSVSKALKYQFSVDGKTKTVGADVLLVQVNPNSVKPNENSSKEITQSQKWQARPKTTLPKNTAVKLLVTPGLASPQGNLKSIKADTVEEFHTFGDFKFVGISCSNTAYRTLTYSLDELDRAKCNPAGGVTLNFSTPLDPNQLHGLLQLWRTDGENDELSDELAETWAEPQRWQQIYGYHRAGQLYPVPLPLAFKPKSSFAVRSLARDAEQALPKDMLGQTLSNTVQATFKTRHFTPVFQVAQQDIVLESQVNSDVPIALTNIDSLEFNYTSSTQSDEPNAQKSVTLEPDFNKDVSAMMPLGIKDLLGGRSGVVTGYFSSPSVAERSHKQALVAQVTPYHVHAKIGHFSSLVWVTELATGELVNNAKVELLRANSLLANQGVKVFDSGLTDKNGVINLAGSAKLDPDGELHGWCNSQNSCPRLLVRVTKGENSAVLPIQYSYQVHAHSDPRVYSDRRNKHGHVTAWGTTAQGLYRQGDTIQYKVFVRDQNIDGLAPPPAGKYMLRVEDESGKVVHAREGSSLSEHGSLSGEIVLAENAAMGWYQFILGREQSEDELYAMRVLVTDFTPSPFRLSQQTNGDLFTAGQELVIDASASLHAGGPFTGADANFEVQATPSPFVSDHPIARCFNFSDYASLGYRNLYRDYRQTESLLTKTVALDAAGKATASITLPTLEPVYISAELDIQTSVADDRGKDIFQNSTARYLGVDRLVGLRSNKWVYESDKQAALDYLVVDRFGKPIAGTEVNIAISKRGSKASKTNKKDSRAKRSHHPQHTETWVEVAACSDVSKDTPKDSIISCAFTPESAGVYRFSASIKDTQDRPQSASQQIWVTGKGQISWQEPDTNSLVMVPEKDEFSVGDKARFLVKNPHPGAQALITIERYGVIDSWQQTLEGSAPVIEFDIKPNYLPGVYLSVLLTTPRSGNEIPEAGAPDPNKPTYKLGYQQLNVSDPDKAIKLDIKSNAPSYKPGEIVTLTIKPELSRDTSAADIELAVSVLDEAVFDLVIGGSKYFDPYAGFNKLGALGVENYNLLTQLIGLQKFSDEKLESDINIRRDNFRDQDVAFQTSGIELSTKTGEMRESSFNSLEAVAVSATRVGSSDEPPNTADMQPRDNLVDSALWQDQVTINDDGTVTIKFKAPDNLTAWRVLAIATTPSDRMGLSEHSFKVNQLTEIRPVMPNQVMEADIFNAGFSVHNRSSQARTLTVTIEPQGDAVELGGITQTVELAAHARETVFLPMSAGRLGEGVQQGSIDYVVRAYDQVDGDALKHSLAINKRRNLSGAAVYGSTTGELVKQAIRFPSDIASDLGGLRVTMSPTIISSVDGAFQYMRDYPYACWEQKLTKAVMASHYKNLKPYFGEDLQWPDSKDLPQATLDAAIGHQASNGGMGYFLPNDEYVSPYLSAYTALAFSWLRDEGYVIPLTVQENLHEYLNQLLRQDNFPQHFSKGMKATVRAVALSALARTGDLSKVDLQRYLSQSQEMSLFGKAQLLTALTYFENTEAEQKTIIGQLLANSNSSAGKIGFNELSDSGYARILSSSMRSNCAILSSLSNAPDLLVDQDLPAKLAQTVVANRKGRSHWENTQDNVFCMNALSQYAKAYESQKPQLSAEVALGNDVLGKAQFSDYKDASKALSIPMQSELVGQDRSMTIEHTGQGRVYYQTLLQYSNTQAQLKRENSGIDLRRELSVYRDEKWQLLNANARVQRGDLVRTDLFVSVPADRNFVAVRDPVPGGLEPVNPDLATSGLSLSVEQLNAPVTGSHVYSRDSWQRFSYSPWGFYHQELGHDAVTFYSDYLAKGQYHLTYFSQAIATGKFARQPAHAEEMYHPDVYGKSLVGELVVAERTVDE